ncbi:hypothetical protein [Aeromonas bivalvium]|uniref:hypothetical protein n=1 Tax=Aeromonas bivalvium TaxID=440079 RepID=UPI0038CF5FEE
MTIRYPLSDIRGRMAVNGLRQSRLVTDILSSFANERAFDDLGSIAPSSFWALALFASVRCSFIASRR